MPPWRGDVGVDPLGCNSNVANSVSALGFPFCEAATARPIERPPKAAAATVRDVPDGEDPSAELRRRFEAVVSDPSLDDLREFAKFLHAHPGQLAEGPTTPAADLRRPRLRDTQVFQLRVELMHSEPPIWRRLEVRSDITLDVVHRVLQAAFGWANYHLYRFSLGGDPFDPSAQLFLCPWDVEEGELEDAGGIPDSEVRLDETMQQPGDVLRYVYDYGDNWELTLRLEQVTPAPASTPAAVATDGRRAAPPEDCGSLRTADELATVLKDPAHLDLERINADLHGPFFALTDHGVNRSIVTLIDRLAYGPDAQNIDARVLALLDKPTIPREPELTESLVAFQWLLDRAAMEGIQLTAAGYMKPADVRALAAVLPTSDRWSLTAAREIDAHPVQNFREAVQSVGLLRKYKGALLLTKAGAAARHSTLALWEAMSARLLPKPGHEDFERVATRVLLLYAATCPRSEPPFQLAADALTYLGWRTHGTSPVERHALYWLPATTILRNATTGTREPRDDWQLSPVATALAKAALLPGVRQRRRSG